MSGSKSSVPMLVADDTIGIWVTREDAAAGGRGSWHRKARVAARDMYETISFHTHSLVVEDGARSWELRDHVN